MTGGDHPSRRILEQLAEGCLATPQTASVLVHLSSGCDSCRRELAAAFDGPAVGYDFAIHRAKVKARRVVRELQLAKGQSWEQLTSQVADPAIAGPQAGHFSWAWCELLLETAGRLRRTDPANAVDTAVLAVSAAQRLKEPYPLPVIADLRTRAWAELGNLQRIVGALDRAEDSFRQALACYKEGTADEMLLARIEDLLGSLFRDQRRFPDAHRALERAAFLYGKYGETHLVGRALVSQGIVFIHCEEPAQAIEVITRAFTFLDLCREPYLTLAAVHNTLYALADIGQHATVAQILPTCRLLWERYGTFFDGLRLLGLEAKIASALGARDRAEELYRETKDGFTRAGLPCDAAFVALHLAALLLEQGRATDALPLVDEVLASFQERGILRETLAALLLLREAVEQGRATAAVVRTLAEQVQRLATAQPGR